MTITEEDLLNSMDVQLFSVHTMTQFKQFELTEDCKRVYCCLLQCT